MNRRLIMLICVAIMVIMVIMVAFAFKVGTNIAYEDCICIRHQAVRDGTWVDTSAPYKLPEKKHFWTLP